MLLVLDNCEHLIEGIAPQAAALLLSCPNLKLLTTSREALRVPGEWVYTVPPLTTPPADVAVDLDAAEDYQALTLFSERARAVRADFHLDSQQSASSGSHMFPVGRAAIGDRADRRPHAPDVTPESAGTDERSVHTYLPMACAPYLHAKKHCTMPLNGATHCFPLLKSRCLLDWQFSTAASHSLTSKGMFSAQLTDRTSWRPGNFADR